MTIDTPRHRFLLALFIFGLFGLVYADLFTLASTFTHDTLVWYGSFHYYVESLARGEFPYWDPYLITGTPFYPNVPLHGLLDPLVLICVLAVKYLGISPLTAYVYFRLARLFLFVSGAYFFFRTISGHRTGSLLAAGVLLFAAPHSYFPQFGTVDTVYLAPWAMHFLLSFLQDPAGPRRAYFLATFTLVSGLSMVVYVPSFYLFNLIIFLGGAAVFQTVPLRPVLDALRKPRLAVFAAACLLAIGLMAAPPLLTMMKDASGDGELFPMQRIVQKNDRVFKQIMASDVDTGSLSEKFTNNRGIFNSWGNVVGMLTPDIPHWLGDDMTSYIHLYLGIIPVILILIGIRFGPRRFRPLLLLLIAVSFLNGFSAAGVHDRPFNMAQRVFNAFFPPLSLYQGRENFGYFVMLYLGAFLAMGLGAVIDRPEEIAAWRRAVLVLCLGLIALKAALAGVAAGSFPATSGYDLFALFQFLLFAAMIILLFRGQLGHRAVVLALLLLTAIDLAAVNLRYRGDVLQKSDTFYNALATAGEGEVPGDFQYFREPAVMAPMRHPLAFEESIFRTKGALSLGFNHSLFTTKRYYDFFTHVPPENQFFLNGMVFPILQFYPLDRIRNVRDGNEVLQWHASSSGPDVARFLFVEKPGLPPRRVEVKDFSRYPDAPWLMPDALLGSFNAFYHEYGPLSRSVRERVRGSVMTVEARITVTDFSANEVSAQVVNQVEGYLYYNDGWSRYWQAFDNGREVPVLIGNYAFKAVPLGPGEHIVRFVFSPTHYKVGLIAYYFGLLTAGGMVAFLAARIRR